MATIGSASLAITPSFKGFQSNLESGTGKAMTAAGVTGGTAFGDSAGRSAGTKFRAHVRSFAKVAAVGLGLATAGAIKFAGDSIAEAREAQKVGALTASTIKATGGAARVTAKHVSDLAGKISAKTGIDDEAIQAGQNMLLTFKNIRNEAGEGNKIFDASSRVLTDFSAAMGTDAKSSAIQLGKALNDPVKGVTALGRAGVQFSEDQKAAIKKMVESGDILGAQKVVLRELKSEFGGAAAAQATEADKLSVAWGNFKEEIGTELLPVMDDLARFLRKKGIPAAKDFAGWVRDDMIPAVKDGADAIEPLVEGVKDLAGFLNDLPKPAKIAGIAAILGGITYGKLRGGNTGPGGLLGGIGKAVGLAKPVPVFVTNPGFGKPGGVPGKKPIPLAPALAIPATIAVGNAAAIRANKNNGVELGATSPGGSGLTLPKGALDFSEESKKVDTYNKSLGRMNDGWAKVRTQVDNATKSTQIYDRAFDTVPKVWTTVFEAPGLARNKALVEQYGSFLDGLDGRTITTFFKSVGGKNDTGELGDPRFHNASGTPWWHGNGSTWVGENGPEVVTLPRGSSITPANEVGTGGVTFDFRNSTVMAHDYDDFMAQAQRRTRGSSLDGVR